jgi:hypothetical protein
MFQRLIVDLRLLGVTGVDQWGPRRYTGDPGGERIPQPVRTVESVIASDDRDRLTAALGPWRPLSIAGLGGLVSALPLAAIPFVPLAGDAAAVVVTAAGASMTGWLWWERRKLDQLPLVLAPAAASGRVDGIDVYRFRARLGLGRAMRAPEAEVLFEPTGGAPVSLGVVSPAQHLCGPWTIVATDPGGRVRAGGHLVVKVQVHSGGRSWSAERRFPVAEVVVGRFDRGVRRGRRGLVFGDGWDSPTPSDVESATAREPGARP